MKSGEGESDVAEVAGTVLDRLQASTAFLLFTRCALLKHVSTAEQVYMAMLGLSDSPGAGPEDREDMASFHVRCRKACDQKLPARPG